MPLVKRPDLIVWAQTLGGQKYLGVKDPLALRYYHLRPEEFFLLQQLDGRTSAAQIQAAFECRFAPRKLGFRQLQGFCSLAYREGLVVADAAGQGDVLFERRQQAQRREWFERFSNPLAVRFRGVDPEPLLDWLYPRLRWLFSPGMLAAGLLLVLSAAVWVLVQFDEFQARLPEFAVFFAPRGWLWLALTLAGCKVLHELGHALMCKHYGGRCHELGLMFLVFTPCLYVNVSDAWMLPSKWQRMAVSGAGMAVELILAAVAVFVWWFSAPGLLNALCLRVMFLGSLSTLIFNGNPLLRYDGYFLLSDWCEAPNLRQRADAAVRQLAARWILGSHTAESGLYPESRRLWLVAYSLASWAYRLVILIAILWFCYAVLQPLGLQVLVQLLTLMTLAGLVVVPMWRAARYWGDPVRSQTMNKRRAAITAAATVIGLAAVLTVPLPHRIRVPAAVQPQAARRVYVPVAGRLTWAIASGAAVRRGEPLGRLENPDLELELARLRGQREVLLLQLQSLKSRSAQQAARGVGQAESAIPAAEQALADVEQRLAKRQQEQQRLTLTAPVAGTVLPPRRRTAGGAPGELPSWHGQLLDEANRGAVLDSGTLFCMVGQPNQMELLVVISQAEIGLVQLQQRVDFQAAQLAGRTLTGRIEELSQIEADVLPPELVAAGVLPVLTEPEGRRRLADVFYQARVTLEPHDAPLLPGAVGRARIHAEWLSLGQRLVRDLRGTFRFR